MWSTQGWSLVPLRAPSTLLMVSRRVSSVFRVNRDSQEVPFLKMPAPLLVLVLALFYLLLYYQCSGWYLQHELGS